MQLDDVVMHLQAGGARVSRRRVLDWVQKGLLPHPRRVGRGRGRGVVFEWDDDVLMQARSVNTLLSWNRRVGNILLPLWLLGYPVETERVLAVLRRRLAKAWQPFSELDKDALLDTVSSWAVRRSISRRLAPFEGADSSDRQVIAEADQDHDRHERDAETADSSDRQVIAEASLSLFLVRGYRPSGDVRKLISRIYSPAGKHLPVVVLRFLGKYASLPRFLQALDQATPEEVERARADIKQLWAILLEVAAYLESSGLNGWIGGLHSPELVQLFARCGEYLFLLDLSLRLERNAKYSEAFDGLRGCYDAWICTLRLGGLGALADRIFSDVQAFKKTIAQVNH